MLMGSSNGSKSPNLISNYHERRDLHITVRGNVAYIYKGKYSAAHGAKRSDDAKENLKKRKYTGKLSDNARKHIKKKLTTWSELIAYHNIYRKPRYQRKQTALTFLTLTLPSKQQHTDQTIKQEILSRFIECLQRDFDVKNYFWRAEPQKNNNIHFHLLLDTYLDKDVIRRKWNHYLNNLNYINEFRKKHHHSDPPTTKIEGPRDSHYLFKYVVDYSLKEAKGREIEGKVWGMSEGLKKIETFTANNKEAIDILIKYYLRYHPERIQSEQHTIRIVLEQPLITQSPSLNLQLQYKQYLELLYYLYYRDRHDPGGYYELKQYTDLDLPPDELIDYLLRA